MKMLPQDLVANKRITLDNGRLLQVGALVYRPASPASLADSPLKQRNYEVLLITSRRTGRWIIPKGWPMRGRTLAQAALIETYEEAGIRGISDEKMCGHYHYAKNDMPMGENNRFHVVVFPVLYQRQAKRWPEQSERRVEWMSPAAAAARVEESGLKKILKRFAPPKSLEVPPK